MSEKIRLTIDNQQVIVEIPLTLNVVSVETEPEPDVVVEEESGLPFLGLPALLVLFLLGGALRRRRA